MAFCFIRTCTRSKGSIGRALKHLNITVSKRSFTFSYNGPRKLDDLMKTEAIEGKTSIELADIWYTYHEEKDNVFGLVIKGEDGEKVLSRASQCHFFLQPVFRDDGYFMLVSQFQQPSHFICAYLEDYKMDPLSATPLITFSLFDDYSKEKNITLVRCDILSKGIEEEEGRKVVENLLESYSKDQEYQGVVTFNKKPDVFDFDDYVSRMKNRWATPPADVDI